jgi:hypothetical protein
MRVAPRGGKIITILGYPTARIAQLCYTENFKDVWWVI